MKPWRPLRSGAPSTPAPWRSRRKASAGCSPWRSASRWSRRHWIAGEGFPPHEAFLQALDIVAACPRVDPAARKPARSAQARADRLQAAANRVRESAERLQASAERAQAQAELMRARTARADPEPSSSGQFRQVQPKDGAPASNKPAQDVKKAKG